MKRIEKSTYIEELIEVKPSSLEYLLDRGIACLVCGEPIWGTLGEVCHEKGYDEEQIAKFVEDINALD